MIRLLSPSPLPRQKTRESPVVQAYQLTVTGWILLPHRHQATSTRRPRNPMVQVGKMEKTKTMEMTEDTVNIGSRKDIENMVPMTMKPIMAITEEVMNASDTTKSMSRNLTVTHSAMETVMEKSPAELMETVIAIGEVVNANMEEVADGFGRHFNYDITHTYSLLDLLSFLQGGHKTKCSFFFCYHFFLCTDSNWQLCTALHCACVAAKSYSTIQVIDLPY